MQVVFDEEKIMAFLRNLYNITNLNFYICDEEMSPIVNYTKREDYCAHISTSHAVECHECDLKHIAVVKKSLKPLYYTCHAGLCEYIAPILYDNVVIAYLFMGQFRDKEGKYSNKKKVSSVAKNYGFGKETLLRLWEGLPALSNTELESIAGIIQDMIRYMWLEGYFRLKEDSISTKIEKFIDEHISEELSVEILSRNFYLSASALQVIFRNEFHDSAMNHILSKRIALAKTLLKATPPLPINEIARRVGIPDYNYFSRIFRKRECISPSEYRKQ